ncbi:MAG: hypothetical protein HY830_24000 [Actinobacteria bacterium]|nr:hypothetical protein [Actinomycetota bacterium]
MTRPDQVETAVRRALEDAVAGLPPVTTLVEGMHARAARIRRRRRTVSAAVAVAVVVGGVGGLLPRWGGTGTPPDVPPAGSSRSAAPAPATRTPAQRPDGPVPSGPATSGAATSGPSTPGTPSGRPAAPLPRPAVTSAGASADDWSRRTPALDETFAAGPLDRRRWTPYVGSSAPVTDWTPDAVTVSGGTLRIAVEPVLPRVRAGGVKAVAEHRTGRWEVRWRMSAGGGAIAQLDLLGDGPDGVSHAATLDPSRGTLTVQDLVHGTETRVAVDGREYHSLAVETTPRGVRWLLDGVVVDDRPGTAPRRPLVLALQAFVSEPACAAQPPAAGCPGPSVAGTVLEVDRVRFWPYRS